MSDTGLNLSITVDPNQLKLVQDATRDLQQVLSGLGVKGGAAGLDKLDAQLKKVRSSVEALKIEEASLALSNEKLSAQSKKLAADQNQLQTQLKLTTASLSQLAKVDASLGAQLLTTKREIISTSMAMRAMSVESRAAIRETQALNSVNQMANKEFATSVGIRAAMRAQSSTTLAALKQETLALIQQAYAQGTVTFEQLKAIASERGYQATLTKSGVVLKSVTQAETQRAEVQNLAAMKSMRGEAAAQRLIGIQVSGAVATRKQALELSIAAYQAENYARAQLRAAAATMQGEAAAQRLIGVQTSSAQATALLARSMTAHAMAFAALARVQDAAVAATMRGEVAAQRLIGAQTAGVVALQALKLQILDKNSAMMAAIAAEERLTIAQERAIAVNKVVSVEQARRAATLSAIRLRTDEVALAEVRRSQAQLNAAVRLGMLNLEEAKSLGLKVSNTAATNAKTAATARTTAATNAHSGALNANTAAAATNLKATRGLTQGQMELHGALRGAAGASGALWLTYGRIVPLLAAVSVITTGLRSFKIGSAFETELRYIQGLSQETSASIDILSESILELARTTIYTPTQIVKGMRVLMQAGLSTRQAMEGIVPVLRLARVGEMDVADAANLAQTAMHAFGLTAGEISHIVNTLGAAASMSATNVKEMAAAMTTGSEVGTLYGTQLEEMNASLTVMAQRHLVGQSAGTAFKNMMRDIGGVTAEAQKMVKGLGIETHDLSGELRPLIPLLGEIKRSLAEFDPKSRQLIMRQWMTRRGIRAFVPLLEEAEGFLIEAYARMLTASEGVPIAKSIEDQLTEAFSGQNLIAVAKFESTLIDAFRKVEQSAASMIERIGELGRGEGFTRFVDGVVGGSVRAVHFLMDHYTAILNLAKAYLVYKAAMYGAAAATAAVTGMSKLFAGMAVFIPQLRAAAMLVSAVAASVVLFGGTSAESSAGVKVLGDEVATTSDQVRILRRDIADFLEKEAPLLLEILEFSGEAVSTWWGMLKKGAGEFADPRRLIDPAYRAAAALRDIGSDTEFAITIRMVGVQETIARLSGDGGLADALRETRVELELQRKAFRENGTAIKNYVERLKEAVEASAPPPEFRKHEEIIAENKLRHIKEEVELNERLARLTTEQKYAHLDARATAQKAARELASAYQVITGLINEQVAALKQIEHIQAVMKPIDIVRLFHGDDLADKLGADAMVATSAAAIEQVKAGVNDMYARRLEMAREHIEQMKKAESEGAVYIKELIVEIQGEMTSAAEKLGEVDTWSRFDEGAKKIRDRMAEMSAQLTADGKPLAELYINAFAIIEQIIGKAAALAAPVIKEKTVEEYMSQIGFADPDFYEHELNKIAKTVDDYGRSLSDAQIKRYEANKKRELADRRAKETGLDDINQIMKRIDAIGLYGAALDRHNDRLAYQEMKVHDIKGVYAELYRTVMKMYRDKTEAHQRSIRLQEHELEIAQARARLELNRRTASMGSREAEHLQRMFDIQQQGYRDIQKAMQGPAPDFERAAELGNQMKNRLAVERDGYAQSLAMSKNWRAGVAQSLSDHADDVTDMYARVGELAADQFQKMEDALLEFIETGKLSFTDLINHMIKEIMRLMIRNQITGPLAGLIGGLVGGGMAGASRGLDKTMATSGLWHNGGVVGRDRPTSIQQVPASLFATAPRLHNGLRADEFPAILQRGEQVIPKKDVQSGWGNISVSVPVTVESGSKALIATLQRRIEDTVIEVIRSHA